MIVFSLLFYWRNAGALLTILKNLQVLFSVFPDFDNYPL